MHVFAHPTPGETEAYLRRARALRSDAVHAFFRWIAGKIAHREHGAPTAKWA